MNKTIIKKIFLFGLVIFLISVIEKFILFSFLIFLSLVLSICISVKRNSALLFDMNKINGVSDNNPYQIRNDVYDFLIKSMDESGIPAFKEEKVRNVFLNYVKNELVAIKNFSNKSRAIDISINKYIIFDCIYNLRKENYGDSKYGNYINEETKYQKVIDFFSDIIIGKSAYQKSEYAKIVLNSKDLDLINDIINSIEAEVKIPKEIDPQYHPEICNKFFSRVLEESEFWN